MTRIPSQLGRYVSREPLEEHQLDGMARAAWRKGLGLWLPMRVIEGMPEMDRRYLETIGDERYGKRRASRWTGGL